MKRHLAPHRLTTVRSKFQSWSSSHIALATDLWGPRVTLTVSNSAYFNTLHVDSLCEYRALLNHYQSSIWQVSFLSVVQCLPQQMRETDYEKNREDMTGWATSLRAVLRTSARTNVSVIDSALGMALVASWVIQYEQTFYDVCPLPPGYVTL